MKISENVNLTQKRNFMVFLNNLSLDIKKTNFIEETIYGELSYRLATDIYNTIPHQPAYQSNSQQDLRNYCDKYIDSMISTGKNFYIVFDTSNAFLNIDNKYIASPNLPLVSIKNTDLYYWYQLLSKGNGIDNLLITSIDLLSGIFTEEYADYPTKDNNWSDKTIYECFIW